jgi:REP element-mobilizing transposase RayT
MSPVQMMKELSAPVASDQRIFSFSTAICRNKNVFVTEEYCSALTRAFKQLETTIDLCNLAYVIMPNYFSWMFKASPKKNDPRQVYGELKRIVAREILTNLMMEAKDQGTRFKLLDVFKNRKVTRSQPSKILQEFKDEAQKFEGRKFKVWQKGGRLKEVATKGDLAREIEYLKTRPIAGRVKLAEKPEEYPYLFISEELEKELLVS